MGLYKSVQTNILAMFHFELPELKMGMQRYEMGCKSFLRIALFTSCLLQQVIQVDAGFFRTPEYKPMWIKFESTKM